MTEHQQADAVVMAESAVGREDAEITELVSSAEALTITTTEEMGASSALLTTIKGRQKGLTDLRLSITKPMDAAKKRVMEVFQPAVDRLASAELTLKRAVLAYTQDQERLRREAQAKVDEEARLERQRLQEQAERERDAGHDDLATISEQIAETIEAPTVQAPPPPTGAVHVRTTWHAEVVDLAALAKACAEGQQPIALILPDMAKLNAMARTLKRDLAIPGVRAVAEQGVAARS